MTGADPRVEEFIAGCTAWQAETAALRTICREGGLGEALKWGKPCFTHAGANVAIIQGFRDFCALMFFKGVLLDDPAGLLRMQGPNSQAARRLEFRSEPEIAAAAPEIRALISAAIGIEEAGLKPSFPAKSALRLPDELTAAFDADPGLKAAFEALTPGRRRAYVMHFSDARQSATRAARIARNADRIRAGRGMNDR